MDILSVGSVYTVDRFDYLSAVRQVAGWRKEMGLPWKYFGDNYNSVSGVFGNTDFGSCGIINT